MKKIFLLAMIALLFAGCVRETPYFEGTLTFPKEATPEQKIQLAAQLVPTPRQYEWQQLELIAFIHFGMNTFSDKELGEGTEDPKIFNPTDFDAEQWVLALREAGFKMLVLTAKHHDGFCLWPTKTTKYSVTASPWRNGQGDVVRAVKNACDEYGMKFGIYLSPWDRNAPSYGKGDAYNTLFVKQLSELLSAYGSIHEVWLDGFNDEDTNGKIQKYDWERFYRVIDSLQPQAVKAVMGNDVRWVGNEQGLGRATEWSVTPFYPDTDSVFIGENKRLGIISTAEDLGSRKLIKEAKTLYWYPSEVDVSIRPGWFYHSKEDSMVKTLGQLINIYYKSVGMNSVLFLNIPPDTSGKLSKIDVERLKELGIYIAHTFKNNKLLDGDAVWKTAPGGVKEFFITSGQPVNTIMLQEDIQKGQRVEAFRVEGWISDRWELLAEGTTIGYKRLVKFADCKPEKIRLSIIRARSAAHIKKVGAYYAYPIQDKPLVKYKCCCR